ncbi:MAG: hypothetical protein M1821_000595 [Bathelium mastoideum]|nr:MAG: hypothetical protein M1821_000595 [Bathelium mastoideum]KAI9683058.1 MAG: hypothetical protein M1822_006253 [Bathelium mastoideum]
MPSFQSALVLTTLATSALAAPAPAAAPLVPRSFEVPRVRNVNAPPRDGAAAMAKAFSKYGWGTIGAQKAKGMTGASMAGAGAGSVQGASNGTTGKGDDGSVNTASANMGAEFLSPVTIGNQKFNMDFDTGSSDLWVFTNMLPQQSIGQHQTFVANQSPTFKQMQGATWQISYGDGSGAAGVVGTDTVNIGGATVTNQAVEQATAVSQSFVQDMANDGLVGLAFSQLNTVKPQQQKTFFANVMPMLDQPLFTANLKNDSTGKYQFGTVDQTAFTGGQLNWAPVDSSQGFWMIQSNSFAVGNQQMQNPSATPAIADTGTSLLLVDDMVAQAYYSQVPGAQLNQQAGGFTYPCSTTPPNFSVAIGNGGYMATVPGNMITFAQVDQATCFGGVQSNMGAPMQIYGDTMFKSQFVAFNGGNMSLGVAPKAGVFGN